MVEMGLSLNMFCFANDPFECELVYDGAEILHEGQFKCHLRDIDVVRQSTGLDDDLVSATDGYFFNGTDDDVAA